MKTKPPPRSIVSLTLRKETIRQINAMALSAQRTRSGMIAHLLASHVEQQNREAANG